MEDFQREKTEELRIRKVLSLFGFIIVNGLITDFIGTGKWFKFVRVQEQKYLVRYAEFDDGWSYQWYWGRWHESWKFLKIMT